MLFSVFGAHSSNLPSCHRCSDDHRLFSVTDEKSNFRNAFVQELTADMHSESDLGVDTRKSDTGTCHRVVRLPAGFSLDGFQRTVA